MGFCPQCRAGSLVETSGAAGATPVRTLGEHATALQPRLAVGMGEVDEVLGGGVVPGAVVLLGGEPGVGKSTLVLQMADALLRTGRSVMLASGEESGPQIADRAARLGVDTSLPLFSDRDVAGVEAAAASADVLIVDSVQTLTVAGVGGGAGGVAQVREASDALVRHAKRTNTAVVLIGHVTKDGGLAGPKLLEHMVDVVLYLEGETAGGLRILRSLKNRFGPSHQTALFEMSERGLVPVADPSRLLTAGWSGSAAGSIVFPGMEGKRPILVEIQALVAPTSTPQPRRSVRGLESARLHQTLAALERHAGLPFRDHEVYVAVSGGVKIREPGADLPVALAVASSLLGMPLGRAAAWGEVGLTGEVRPVSGEARRRAEAERLGITAAVDAAIAGGTLAGALADLDLHRRAA